MGFQGVGADKVGYEPTPPDTSTDVQAALDWRASHIGSQVVVDSWPDALELFGPLAGGVLTVNKGVYQTGTVVVPSTVSLLVTGTSSWTGAAADVLMVGNVDGPLIRGDLILKSFTIVNQSVHADALDIEGFATGTRVTLVEGVTFAGTRSGWFHDTEGLIITECKHFGPGCTTGHKITGTNKAIRHADSAATLVGPTFGVLVVESSATFTALAIQGGALELPLATQFGVAISEAIVVPPGVIIQIVGQLTSDPSGAPVLRQDVNDMKDDDLRLVIESCPSGRTWSSVGTASREDVGNPLTVNLSVTNPQVIPWREGVTALETELIGPVRATLYKNPADNYDTYVEYAGPKVAVVANAHYRVAVKRAGGGSNDLRCFMERNDAPGYTGWVEIPGTSTPTTNNASFGVVIGAQNIVVNPRDRVRPKMEDTSGANDAQVSMVNYGLDAGG